MKFENKVERLGSFIAYNDRIIRVLLKIGLWSGFIMILLLVPFLGMKKQRSKIWRISMGLNGIYLFV